MEIEASIKEKKKNDVTVEEIMYTVYENIIEKKTDTHQEVVSSLIRRDSFFEINQHL